MIVGDQKFRTNMGPLVNRSTSKNKAVISSSSGVKGTSKNKAIVIKKSGLGKLLFNMEEEKLMKKNLKEEKLAKKKEMEVKLKEELAKMKEEEQRKKE